MKKGEKMFSFVKYEKELESDYRRSLDEIKRPEEIHKVFSEYAFKFLKMVKDDLDDRLKEQIKLIPEEENFKIDEELLEKLGDLVKKSDLMAILKRMADSAIHRYLKLKRDDERTDLFRIGDSSKIR